VLTTSIFDRGNISFRLYHFESVPQRPHSCSSQKSFNHPDHMSNIKSMSLIHPDKIFSNVSRVPLPRPWPDVISPTPTIPVRFQWQESEDNRALVIPLEDLQMALRSVHKRKVTWPADESYLSGYLYYFITVQCSNFFWGSLSPSEYLRMLLQPIADLFNQLCISQHGKTPVGCISVDLGDCESTPRPFYFISAE